MLEQRRPIVAGKIFHLISAFIDEFAFIAAYFVVL